MLFCPKWSTQLALGGQTHAAFPPYKYISDSMGHSGNGDITSNYIGAYPLAKMLEYNAYLLKESKQENKKADLLELLKSMSPEERAALMEEASK